MNHKIISTDSAPKPGNYSQGCLIELNDYAVLYTSGQTGNDPKTGQVVGKDIQSQTEQALQNILAITEGAGGEKENIVQTTVFIKNMAANKVGFEQEYKKFFPSLLPARSLVEVNEIPQVDEPTIVMIAAVAYIPKKR